MNPTSRKAKLNLFLPPYAIYTVNRIDKVLEELSLSTQGVLMLPQIRFLQGCLGRDEVS